MKLTKTLLRKLIKEEIELEGDFTVGSKVWWYPTERVVKTRPSSGKKYVDYERVEKTGEILELYRSGGIVGGAARVMPDGDGGSIEIEISELRLSPDSDALVTA